MNTPTLKSLKAYIRIDGSGRDVPSSLIYRKNKPTVGKWKEINSYECCIVNTTTTTSTTFFTREYCVWSTDIYQNPIETSEYNLSTNTLNNVPIDNDLVGVIGIASTDRKFWKFELNTLKIREWFVNSYPAVLTFNETYSLQSNGETYTNTIAAKNNTVLLSTRIWRSRVYLGEINLSSNGLNPYFAVLVDITDKIQSNAISIMYTTDNRVIIIGIRNSNEYWLLQYYLDPNFGFTFEMELNLDSIPFNPASTDNTYQLITYGHEIYIIRSNINSLFKVGLTYPYTITEVTADLEWGEHRKFESSTGACNDVSFTPQVPQCGTTIPNVGGTFTYFGVTGIVTTLSGGIVSYPFLNQGYYAICSGMWMPPYSWVSTDGPATIVLTFDSPINNVGLVFSILDLGDNFTITTNTEVPSITMSNSCYATVSGNQIITDPTPGGVTGSGQFTITTTTPYTVLTIVATNGGNGGPIGLSCDPNAPLPTTTTTSSTTLAPSGFNTIYTNFESL